MAYFDVHRELTRNPAFGNIITEACRKLSLAEKEGNSKAVAFHLTDILRKCHYNMGLLTTYFFPAYPKTKPMTLTSRPFSFGMYGFNLGGETTVKASRQIGKCCAGDTSVNTLDSSGNEATETMESLFTRLSKSTQSGEE